MTAPKPGAELERLAARVESAGGADREIDCLIAVAADGFFELPPKYEGGPIGYGYVGEDGGEVHPGHGGDQLVPRYTGSVDAAIALLPEGAIWRRYTDDSAAVYAASPYNAQAQVRYDGFSRLPAIAICAAHLRMLIAQQRKAASKC